MRATRSVLLRPLVGAAMVVALVAVLALAVGLFRGSYTKSVAVTVVSPRAGLVMNPDAKVKMLDLQVGRVDSIEELPDGRAALHLAMDPSQLHLIPSNVEVDVASTTIFGAKYVQLVVPAKPSSEAIRPGQVLDSQHVTVEINTVFQQLTSVLSSIEPTKLNETLGAIARAFSGRGEKAGQSLSDLNAFLAVLEPSLPALSHDIDAANSVLGIYADTAPDLMTAAARTTEISQTIVDEQDNLDAFLVSVIGLADTGNEVVGTNRQAITDVMRLLVPTTDLTNEYHQGLNCALAGMLPLINQPPLPDPGVTVSVSFTLGAERYRYPTNLPKVAAKGGPQCMSLPDVPAEKREPFLITDINANPAQYGNQGILLNSDGLKQLLFGPIAGPPRNSAQIGQPG